MNGIIWIASYPKSGNTWFRIFLENLRADAEQPTDINRLDASQLGASRAWIDDELGYASCELTARELDRLRPRLYSVAARTAKRPRIIKVHDACVGTADGKPLFPPEITLATIYMVRNPLDVCVSWAHHLGVDPEIALGHMANDRFAIGSDSTAFSDQIGQRLGSWSSHVESWSSAPGMGLHLVRYEDLVDDPIATFSHAARALEIPSDSAAISKAVRFSSFRELRAQEKRDGFRERPDRVESFFRRGEVGSWREALTEHQVARIVERHFDAMLRLRYVSPEGTPLV